MNLREAIALLTEPQLKQLQYALEQEMAQYVMIDDHIFIGVHTEPLQHLEILETIGAWSFGRVRC